MGAWSHEPFGNDTACDWAYALTDQENLNLLEETLDRVLAAEDDYLDASDAEEALAAIEVIAKLQGKGTQNDSYTAAVDDWVARMAVRPSPELLAKARQTLQRIDSEDSELRELWAESDELSEWRRSLSQLSVALVWVPAQ